VLVLPQIKDTYGWNLQDPLDFFNNEISASTNTNPALTTTISSSNKSSKNSLDYPKTSNLNNLSSILIKEPNKGVSMNKQIPSDDLSVTSVSNVLLHKNTRSSLSLNSDKTSQKQSTLSISNFLLNFFIIVIIFTFRFQ
jgi:hypothetical protein